MTYQESIDFLYNSLPVFQREGASAYKPGLGTSVALDDLFGNPHREYACIHIAGTNGKGSTAHTLAAVLARAGYRRDGTPGGKHNQGRHHGLDFEIRH